MRVQPYPQALDERRAVLAGSPTVERHRALGSQTRRRILELLETKPLSVAELARELNLHPNTIREHLEQLERAGLASSTRKNTGGRGRPRKIYRSVATDRSIAADSRIDGQGGLIEALVAGYSSDRASENAAYEGGLRTGRCCDVPGKGSTLDPPTAFAEFLARQGFQVMTTQADTITIVDCPVKDVARAHPDVVCAAHQGLLDGFAQSAGLHTAALIPFSAEHQCEVCLNQGQRNGEGGAR